MPMKMPMNMKKDNKKKTKSDNVFSKVFKQKNKKGTASTTVDTAVDASIDEVGTATDNVVADSQLNGTEDENGALAQIAASSDAKSKKSKAKKNFGMPKLDALKNINLKNIVKPGKKNSQKMNSDNNSNNNSNNETDNNQENNAKKTKTKKSNGNIANNGFVSKINSIKIKLILAFAVPVAFIVVLGVISYNTAANAIIGNYEEANLSTIIKTADYYDVIFDNIISSSNEMAGNVTLKNYYSRMYKTDLFAEGNAYNEIQKYFMNVIIGNDMIDNVFVMCKYGNDIRTYNPSSVANTKGGFYEEFSQTEEAAKIDEVKKGFFTRHNFIDSKSKPEYAFTFGRQVYSNSTMACGYMYLDFNVEKINKAIQELDMGKNSIVALIIPDGGEIAGYNDGENIEISAADSDVVYVADKQFFKDMMADSEKNDGFEYVDYKGEKYLFLYSKVEDTGFAICSLVPRTVIMAQALKIRNTTVVIVIIAFIIALLIGSVMASSMSSAMNVMMKQLKKASEGDLTVNVRLNRKDEFLHLADSVNNMISKTKDMLVETSGIAGELGNAADTVSGSSKVLLEATRNITTAISEIEKGVIQQTEDSDNCVRQMDILTDKINVVSDSADNIASDANEAIDTVNNGRKTIDELSEKAGDTVAITKDIITGIQSVDDATRRIESIIAAINEISDQTSLLSLNASIEAARAGEAGKGFAVVADEIRKLAEQSSESVNQIRNIIDDINNKTQSTVTTAMRASDIVASQGTALDKTVSVFNRIEEKVEKLVSELDYIRNSIEDMQQGKIEVIDIIESISSISEETTAMVEEVSATAERQVQAVEDLNTQAENLTSESERLINNVGAFKID